MEDPVRSSDDVHSVWSLCRGRAVSRRKLTDPFLYRKTVVCLHLTVASQINYIGALWSGIQRLQKGTDWNSKVRWSVVWRCSSCYEFICYEQALRPICCLQIPGLCCLIHSLVWRFLLRNHQGVPADKAVRLSNLKWSWSPKYFESN